MHALNPACKFIGLMVSTLLLATQHDPFLNLAVFALCLIAMLLSKVQLKKLCIAMLPILVATVGMFFTGFYFSGGSGGPVNADTLNLLHGPFYNGLVLSSRVLAFGGLGYLFAFTTHKIQLVRSLEQQLHLPPIFAYGMLAAFGIFPNMVSEYKKARAAFAARGIHTPPISPALLRPLLVKSVRWSEELSIAMESKGFSGKHPRSCYEPVPLGPLDVAFPFLCVGLVLIGIYLPRLLLG